jgi:hypothetical protein
LTKANYQDFQRFRVVDGSMAADAEASLPMLIEAVTSAIPTEQRVSVMQNNRGCLKWSCKAT